MSSFLRIRNLSVSLNNGQRVLRSINMDLDKGEVRGLVGESGAGKSMIGKAILGILPRALKIDEGEIFFQGKDLLTLKSNELRKTIGANAALIPQDPLTALNPSHRIGPQITNRLVDILGWKRNDAISRTYDLLDEVQIPDAERVINSFPHELSGGMRQRILIASAFAAEPKLIIADEPTTALDVTVQKQILKLIKEMQVRHGTTLLFVTHDLGVVSKVCQSLSVLYSGKVIEDTLVSSFFKMPQHDYSKALLTATPKYTDPNSDLIPVPEGVLNSVNDEISKGDKEWLDGR
ncbi:MAG: ABC transporter ATP-binding protein [Rhodospirillaceae bacterium]|jgi:peptide/nickel transport system ATP-binding protein|nr:ABC transporter ATP-binding protein [Rhodospirillaceae bacterium]MDA9123189.1 ABC transporter ATP-binding protein [Paracoccaceae bacterium]|tara:strand:- start:1554 stop:2429 length:876 start_codon:yes stop_codon:yes gene_type:complete